MENLTIVTIVIALISLWIKLHLEKGYPECGSTSYFIHDGEKNIVECIGCSSLFPESSAKKISEILIFPLPQTSLKELQHNDCQRVSSIVAN